MEKCNKRQREEEKDEDSSKQVIKQPGRLNALSETSQFV